MPNYIIINAYSKMGQEYERSRSIYLDEATKRGLHPVTIPMYNRSLYLHMVEGTTKQLNDFFSRMGKLGVAKIQAGKFDDYIVLSKEPNGSEETKEKSERRDRPPLPSHRHGKHGSPQKHV